MTKLLSICIPTLNRPEWLLQAINSICVDTTPFDEIEVCISNNCSESDYADIERYIESASSQIKIHYVRHTTRISLDENHHYVKKMASGEYVYLLGDDDFFLRNQLQKLIEFIKANKPDLAIFNGFIVDVNNNFLRMHCNLPPKEYNSLNEAFVDLRDKGSFGAVLSRKDLLQDDDFRQLYETAHAYGCFWLSIFRKFDRSESVKIFIPDFPCVALRSAQKNYNTVDVYYKKIPNWMMTFKKLAPIGLPMKLISDYERSHLVTISSFIFLLSLADSGFNLDLVDNANPTFRSKYRARIYICKKISKSISYKLFKVMYCKYFRAKKINQSPKTNTEISYYLSV